MRKILREKRDIHECTGDVKEHLRAVERKEQIARRQGTFGQLMTAYVNALKTANKPSAPAVEGIFKRHVRKPFSSLVETKANEIEPGHIQQILARMVKAGITRQVNVTRTYLRAAFEFGAKADHDPRTVARDGVLFGLKYNPVAVVPRIAEYERVGERTLSEDELRAYWKALDTLPLIQQATLRFNVAMGCQRIAQLLRADWSAVSFDDETLLLRDSKGRGGSRDHLLPLTAFALEQFQPIRDANSAADMPFTTDGKRAMVIETLSVCVRNISAALSKEQASRPYGNWSKPGLPHTDWNDTGVEDLGQPSQKCEMCESRTIRYAHRMWHPTYPRILYVGAVCARNMKRKSGALPAVHEIQVAERTFQVS